MPKPDYTKILSFVLAHPTELLSLMALFTALQSKDKKQINKAAKNVVSVVAVDIDTTDPDVKKALADLSAALSK